MQLGESGHCEACGADNGVEARFCSRCGANLGATPGATPAARAAADAERKQVTVLFSDLSGYTALSERLDPEEIREIMAGIFSQAAEIIGRYDGHIDKFIGDAVMALFGVPVAHEDDPVRAVRAALELHEVVRAMSPAVEARSGTAIALHSGINTGLVLTGELQFGQGTAGPLGDTINLASRLMNAAPSGEIWVGPETRRLVARACELEELGAREFKGKAEPVVVARVLGTASRATQASHFRGAFVGRQTELGALLGAAEQMRDGRPSAFGIRGDAGTGKTRLVEEFRAKVGDDVQWLEGRAYPYAQNIPYAPIIDLLSRSWAIEETDRPAQVRTKLEVGVVGLVDATGEVLPLILHLFQQEQADGFVIDREVFQERLLHAVRRLLAALAQRAPTVVCLQDLHWADASTVILLRGLTEDLRIPVLLVGNYRPGYTPGAGTQVLELRELSSRQTGELLASLLKAEPPAALRTFIGERSDGNPFYVEEVVNSLIETHVLTRANGDWTLARPLAEAAVPATVRGVIAARIDRLDEPRKRVLREAAVVGREFLYSVVAQVTQQADQLAPSLEHLEAVDLIRAHSPEPNLEYIFKHALTQEVSYDGLLKSERQKLHERVAYAMEGVLAERIPEFLETLAYHFLRGGVTDKAIYYLGEAGRKCIARYALAEATSHFREAYALIAERERSPEESRVLAELIVAWSQVHYYLGTIREWLRLVEKHVEDAERCGDPAVLSLYLGWLGNVQTFHGDLRGALKSIERALEVGRSAGARDAVAHAVAWHTHTLLFLGRVGDVIRSAESLDQSEEEKRNAPYPHFNGHAGLTFALNHSGQMCRARGIAEELVDFGRASGNSRAESVGQCELSFYWLLNLDFERAAAVAQMGMDAAKDPTYRTFNAVFRALALVTDLHFEEAGRLIDDVLPYLQENENYWFGQAAKTVRASVDLLSGHLSSGMRGVFDSIRSFGEHGWEPAVHTTETFVLVVYVYAARRDITPPLGALIRNPWFVFTQALFAARKARRLIERLRAEANERNLRGMHGLIDLCEGRLLAHQGKKAQAREVLERIRRRLAEAGVEHVPAPVAALAAEIEG
ncbi:MAG: AAA family ATPase [Deltaproteobacteria bacterium]|nr:AAA family ATPase [Deltaproteobacteria bacterium]MBI3389922.1 AAA family ATPase [Deltaproteobacteria bacterium]